MKQMRPLPLLRQNVVFQLFKARDWLTLKICSSLSMMDTCDFSLLHYTHVYMIPENMGDVLIQDVIHQVGNSSTWAAKPCKMLTYFYAYIPTFRII